MKLMKKAIAVALSTILTVGMVSTAYAEPGPVIHFLFGTEKEYGENTTPRGKLYEGTDDDDFINFGNAYYILPKTDTISFDIDPSHNVEIRWWLKGVTIAEMEGGTIGVYWEDVPEKTENVIAGKEYPVFPSELQESAAERSIFYSNLQPGIHYSEEYINTMRKFSNEPFIIMTVTDYDLNWQWYWVYQVVDNWPGPDNNQAGTWVSDDQGWRIQYADGSYLTNAWYLSPSSGLWYYMGADGYMLTNTTTPDGYEVNADGVWVQ